MATDRPADGRFPIDSVDWGWTLFYWAAKTAEEIRGEKATKKVCKQKHTPPH
jgi:hypothetical protein